MNLGVQYYRAPFPDSKYWEDDMRRIREAGLDTVQLWILWGWVEAKPGKFVFDDYDRLVELAGKNGLKVVLSTIAEIQPLWIHREVPGSEMITNLGHKVISSSRASVITVWRPADAPIIPGSGRGCGRSSKRWGRATRRCRIWRGGIPGTSCAGTSTRMAKSATARTRSRRSVTGWINGTAVWTASTRPGNAATDNGTR